MPEFRPELPDAPTIRATVLAGPYHRAWPSLAESAQPGTPLLPAAGVRAAGFVAALGRHGITLPDRYRADGGFSIDGGRRAAHRLLALRQPPSAVFCMSDEMAFGVLQAAVERCVAVPSQLSVVGFDDHSVSGAFGLTTVRQPVRQMGRVAARALLEQLANPTGPSHHAIPVDLVERSSTGPA